MPQSPPSSLLVHAIDPARLAGVRAVGTDGHGNRLRPYAATGHGEPLRCCLRYAEPDESITLMSYAPFDRASVWTEVGPVYVHAGQCTGYASPARLPGQLSTGPGVLRTYRGDDTMNYDHNTVVATTGNSPRSSRAYCANPTSRPSTCAPWPRSATCTRSPTRRSLVAHDHLPDYEVSTVVPVEPPHLDRAFRRTGLAGIEIFPGPGTSCRRHVCG